MESPERNPYTYDQLIYDKRGKNTMEKKRLSFHKWCWGNRTVICKRVKLEHSLTPYKEINSKWIKHLHIRPETIKLSEENIVRILFDINYINIFFGSVT